MTDYDYGYWIIRLPGASVASICAKVLAEAKTGMFTRFGSGVRDSISDRKRNNKAEHAFLDAYHAAQNQQRIAWCA